MSQSATSTQFINTSSEKIYLAFTRSLLLRQWLCDFATVHPRPGGRMYLWWNGDFYSAGEYLELEQNRKVKFKWHSRVDPAPSEVTITLTPKGDGTQVSMEHTVPDGEDWKQRLANFKQEWDSTLPNLASLLETGLDRRIYDRPMLGIQISDFNAEIAKAAGVPVTEGIRLADTIEGMGARAAGLLADDVIVEFNGKPVTIDFGSLTMALQGVKGGDIVKVVFYRGAEKHTVDMTLSKRPVWEVPSDPIELSRQARTKYDTALGLLQEVLAGVTDREASFSPAPGEWNARQVLAHLIHSERGFLANIDDLVGGFEHHIDDFGGNSTVHINATIVAYGSIEAMLGELKRLADETVAYLAALPPEFVTWKSNYRDLGTAFLYVTHTESHVDQIRNAIHAARNTG